MIAIVSATRLDEASFWRSSALGYSLRRLGHDERLSTRIAYSNSQGLPEIYNEAIEAPDAEELLVFVHDDVWIDDVHFGDRVTAGLNESDVIGVVGNRRRLPLQPSWAFVDDCFTWDEPACLSGAVAHGEHPFGAIAEFGPSPAECELLDGVFLAARHESLIRFGVRFDVRFQFHFYDLDFCRRARSAGLRLSTWPVGITHQSGGAFTSEAWKMGYQAYLEKWGD